MFGSQGRPGSGVSLRGWAQQGGWFRAPNGKGMARGRVGWAAQADEESLPRYCKRQAVDLFGRFHAHQNGHVLSALLQGEWLSDMVPKGEAADPQAPLAASLSWAAAHVGATNQAGCGHERDPCSWSGVLCPKLKGARRPTQGTGGYQPPG